MQIFALNHMTIPSVTMKDVGEVARSFGVKLRNELEQSLFDVQAVLIRKQSILGQFTSLNRNIGARGLTKFR